MACVSLPLLTSLPGRTRSTHPTSLPPRCVCGGLLVGATTSPPQAAPPAFLSHVTSPLAPPTSMLVQPGLTLAASHRPTFPTLARDDWVFDPFGRVEHAADNPGPHSLCWAKGSDNLPGDSFLPPLALSFLVPPSLNSLAVVELVLMPLAPMFLCLPGALRGSSSARFVAPDAGVFEAQFVTLCFWHPWH